MVKTKCDVAARGLNVTSNAVSGVAIIWLVMFTVGCAGVRDGAPASLTRCTPLAVKLWPRAGSPQKPAEMIGQETEASKHQETWVTQRPLKQAEGRVVHQVLQESQKAFQNKPATGLVAVQKDSNSCKLTPLPPVKEAGQPYVAQVSKVKAQTSNDKGTLLFDGRVDHRFSVPSITAVYEGKSGNPPGRAHSLPLHAAKESGVREDPPERQCGASRGAITRRVEQQMDYATGLAERGAIYSAQEEFIAVLSSVSQARDARNGGQQCQQALHAGLTALNEATDFSPQGGLSSMNIDLKSVLARHETPILKEVDISRMIPMVAMQHYFTYARDQLVVAGAKDPNASQALYRLGRLQCLLGNRFDGRRNWTAPKAIALYSAALAVDPNNNMAANELGVLLARLGQPEAARSVLLYGISVSPEPETMYNLSVVHRRLGDHAAADQTLAEYEKRMAAYQRRSSQLGKSDAEENTYGVRWVSPEEFAQLPNSDIGKPLLSPSKTTNSRSVTPKMNEGGFSPIEMTKQGLGSIRTLFTR